MTEVGTVTRLLFEDATRQIFSLKTDKKSIKVLLSDDQQRVEKGEHVTVDGELINHDDFGQQLHATKITHTPVTHDLIADFMMMGTGIGKAIAERVIKAFPTNLVDVLENKDVESLCSVERVTRATATVIINQWHKQAGKAKLIPFIEGILKNAPPTVRTRIKRSAKLSYAHYGEDTTDKLKEDPYRLWSFGSFKDADLFAKAMGMALDDERRLICAVEEAIYKKYKEGHTQVYPLEFLDELQKIVGDRLALKAVIAANNAANTSPPRIVVRHEENTNPTDSKFAQACREFAEQQEFDDDFLRRDIYNQTYALPGPAIMEQYVQQQLALRLEQSVPAMRVADLDITAYKLPGNHSLNTEQQCAVKMVLNNAITAISGGAGTGKTSILYAVNDMIKSADYDVLQVALAGKAAQRLIQQTDDHAYTITSLLNKIQKDGHFLQSLDTPVFHIDEASMVDLLTMYKVLKAFEGKTIRLVFIGDYAQLPPIGPGLIFHRLMQCQSVPKVELKTNYRSKRGIVEVGERIKAGIVFEANNEVDIIEYDSSVNLMDIVQRQYVQLMKDNEVHVIAATKSLVQQSNIALHKSLRKYDKYIPSAPDFKINDEVIYKRNNERLGLVNGSTGQITMGPAVDCTGLDQTLNVDLVVDFKIEGQKGLLLKDIIDRTRGEYHLQHAYAITCHSAQGSEFDTVVIVLQDSIGESMLVERSWLYTAITRAKKKAVLIVKKGQIESILARGFKFEKINCGLHL